MNGCGCAPAELYLYTEAVGQPGCSGLGHPDRCHIRVEERYRRGDESKEDKHETILSMKMCPVGFLAECSLLE